MYHVVILNLAHNFYAEPVVYRMCISYHMHMIHTVHVRYVPYSYGMFSVPYTYGCTLCVYVLHSIELSIRSGGSMPKAYYSKVSTKGHVLYSYRFIIR